MPRTHYLKAVYKWGRLFCLILAATAFFINTNANAAIINAVLNSENILKDDSTGKYWFPDLQYFTNHNANGDTYANAAAAIGSLNSSSFAGITDWGLASLSDILSFSYVDISMFDSVSSSGTSTYYTTVFGFLIPHDVDYTQDNWRGIVSDSTVLSRSELDFTAKETFTFGGITIWRCPAGYIEVPGGTGQAACVGTVTVSEAVHKTFEHIYRDYDDNPHFSDERTSAEYWSSDDNTPDILFPTYNLIGAWVTGSYTPVDPGSTVPAPAAMFLLGSGLLGLAGFRRKFRKQ